MKIQDALNILNLGNEATQAEIKAAYKKASLEFHPDRNAAGANMMQAINAAFKFLKSLGDPVKGEDGAESYNFGKELNEVLNALLKMEGLNIEMVGNWIWVSGDTFQHKAAIKELGLKWGAKKKMWFYKPSDYKKTGYGNYSMNEIRDMHGNQVLKSYQRKEIAA